MVAVPVFPPDFAVIVVEPAATPVTSPLPFTVATAVLLLAQLIVALVMMFPFASLAVAVSRMVPPTRILPLAGLTSTVATPCPCATCTLVEPDTLDSAAMTSVRLLDRSHAPSAARITTTLGIGSLILHSLPFFRPIRGLGRPTPQ